MKENWQIVAGEYYSQQWETYSEEEKLRRFFLTDNGTPETIWVKLEVTKKGYFQIKEMRKRISFSYNKRKFFTRCSFKSAVVTPHTIRGDKQVIWCYLKNTGDYQKLSRDDSPEALYHFFKTGEAREFFKPSSLLERYYNVSFQKWEEYSVYAQKVAKKCYFVGRPFNPNWSKTRIRDEYTRLQTELAEEESLLWPNTALNNNYPIRVVFGPFNVINSERDLKYWSLIFRNCSFSYKERIRKGQVLIFIYHEEGEPVMGEVSINDNGLVELVQYLGKYNNPIKQTPEFQREFKAYLPWFEEYLYQV